jgi:hypothetical protein
LFKPWDAEKDINNYLTQGNFKSCSPHFKVVQEGKSDHTFRLQVCQKIFATNACIETMKAALCISSIHPEIFIKDAGQ